MSSFFHYAFSSLELLEFQVPTNVFEPGSSIYALSTQSRDPDIVTKCTFRTKTGTIMSTAKGERRIIFYSTQFNVIKTYLLSYWTSSYFTHCKRTTSTNSIVVRTSSRYHSSPKPGAPHLSATFLTRHFSTTRTTSRAGTKFRPRCLKC